MAQKNKNIRWGVVGGGVRAPAITQPQSTVPRAAWAPPRPPEADQPEVERIPAPAPAPAAPQAPAAPTAKSGFDPFGNGGFTSGLAQNIFKRDSGLRDLQLSDTRDKEDQTNALERLAKMRVENRDTSRVSHNKAGLFYSGMLGKSLGAIDEDYTNQRTDQETQFTRRSSDRQNSRADLIRLYGDPNRAGDYGLSGMQLLQQALAEWSGGQRDARGPGENEPAAAAAAPAGPAAGSFAGYANDPAVVAYLAAQYAAQQQQARGAPVPIGPKNTTRQKTTGR